MLDEIFSRYLLGPFYLWCDLVLEFLFFLDDLSIGDRGVIQSPTTTVLEFIYAFRSFRVYSFWCVSPFISMECPSLSHLINVGLKSTLSVISIATPSCFLGP
jgi:hypothetical protein